MTTDDRFLDTLESWLQAEGGSAAPSYTDELLARTSAARQLPRWASFDRWVPARRSVASRMAGVPRPVKLLVVAAVILSLILAAISASSRPTLPPPFGLAANGSLAMATMDGIVIADPDGTNLRRLLELDGVEAMAFSPDGTRLAYRSVDPRSGRLTVLVHELASGDVSDASPGHGVGVGYDVIAWAPDSRHLVTRLVLGTHEDLQRLAVDGSQSTLVAPGTSVDRANAFGPAWSPDGAWISFLGERPGTGDAGLFIVRPDGSEEHMVATAWRYDVGPPSWSPEPARRRLVYVRPDGHLGFVDLAAPEPVLLAVTEHAEPHWPTWSPDGRSIAWFDGGLLVGAVDDLLAGGSPRHLSTLRGGCRDNAELTGTTPCGEPVWSPDGRWIVGPDVLGSSFVAISVDGSRPPVHIPIKNASELTAVGSVAWQRRAP